MWRVWFLRELLRFVGDMAIGIAAVPTVCEDLKVGVRRVAWWSLHPMLGCHDPRSAFQCHVPLQKVILSHQDVNQPTYNHTNSHSRTIYSKQTAETAQRP